MADEEVYLAGDAEAGDDFGVSLGVDFGFGEEDALAAFFVVVGGLEEGCGFTRIHCAETEVELCHG